MQRGGSLLAARLLLRAWQRPAAAAAAATAVPAPLSSRATAAAAARGGGNRASAAAAAPVRLLRVCAVARLRVAAAVRGGGGGDAATAAELPTACPGCGVKLQSADPDKPGFFQVPKRLTDEPAAGPADAQEEEFDDEEEDSQADDERTFLREDDAAAPRRPELARTRRRRRRRRTTKRAAAAACPPPQELPAPLRQTVVCARCYALRHYGRVKNQAAEALLPSFDFERVVGSRLRIASLRTRPVVVLLVDLADFDGSFPAPAARLLAAPELEGTYVVLALTKTDLLPRTASPVRLEQWVRRRAREAGLAHVDVVKFLGSPTGFGVTALSEKLEELSRQRSGGEVWVIGAQNAGKSTLINALCAHYYGKRVKAGPVASHVPGTTLDLVRLEALLPGNRTVIDTPGLLQPHQITPRLTADEARMVLPRRPLRPRTYRVATGGTVTIGGLARVDYVEGPSQTIYLTVWVSEDICTHMGKTEGAAELFEAHAGSSLQPPAARERVAELGRWSSRSVTVRGEGWAASSVDLAIAGLGWVGVGVDGEASLQVWTYEGVGVAVRDALMPDMAKELETPGFDFEKAGKARGGRVARGGGGGAKRRR